MFGHQPSFSFLTSCARTSYPQAYDNNNNNTSVAPTGDTDEVFVVSEKTFKISSDEHKAEDVS